MKVKYLEERTRKNGKKVYLINPSQAVKNALGVGFENYHDDRQAATARAYELAEDYDLWLRRGREDNIHINEDTVDGLYAFFKTTKAYKKLKPNSRTSYDQCYRTVSGITLKGSNQSFGRCISRLVDVTSADRMLQQLEEEVSYHRAIGGVKVLRRVWNIGTRHGKVKYNPFTQMNLEGIPPRQVLWAPEQVDKFISTADAMGLHSMGTLALLCYDLCQRPGDMRQITWEDAFKGDLISFVQEKTGTPMAVPCSERLQNRLQEAYKATPVGHVVLNERTLRPYDTRLYNKYRKEIMEAASLPSNLQMRDLRRTGATEMAEAGATNAEMRSVTGHKTMDVLSIYVRTTQAQASSAVNKRFAAK